MGPAPAPAKGGKKGKEKDKAKEKKAAEKKAAKAAEKAAKKGQKLNPHQLMLEGKRLLCRSIFYSLHGLKMLGLLKDAEYVFGSLQVRYEKRFAAYSKLIQPAPLSYQHYVDHTDFSQAESSRLFNLVAESLRNACTTLEKLAKNPDAPAAMIREAKQLALVAAENLALIETLCPEEGQPIVPPVSKAQV